MQQNPQKRNASRSCWGKIVDGSMGSFLEPPTHPNHRFEIRSVYGDTFGVALSSAVDTEWLDDKTKAEAKKIMDDWTALLISNILVEDWIHQVLGYFKNGYKGQSWNVGDLVFDSRDPVSNQNDHAGVHFIRKYYPQYKLTEADLKQAYWGKSQRRERT